LEQLTGESAEKLRSMSRQIFCKLIDKTAWKIEFDYRKMVMRNSSRLKSYGEEMEERVLANPRITSWKQLRADYLPHVSGRYHTRLLAMTRLGILPIEIETGRWEGVDRSERFCKFEACNGKLGDTCHFLSECAGLKTKGIASVWRCPSGSTPGVWWRETAHQLEQRWREKSLARNITTASDFHFQADLGDAWNCEFDEHVPRPTFLDPGSAPPDDLAAEIFTDGSKKTDVMHAGWGMWGVLLNAMGDVTQIIEAKGHVPTGSDDTEYLGAERGTNMTGELTGIYKALQEIQNTVPCGARVLLRFDCIPALMLASGIWKTNLNKKRF